MHKKRIFIYDFLIDNFRNKNLKAIFLFNNLFEYNMQNMNNLSINIGKYE